MTCIATTLNIREPLSDPACISIAGREPNKKPRVLYCYSSALQNGSEYAEIVCFIQSHAHTGTRSIVRFVGIMKKRTKQL